MRRIKNKTWPGISFPSELRQDLISQDWVVIATGRAKRPEAFKEEQRKRETIPKSQCPFCQIETQEEAVLVFAQGKEVPYRVGGAIPSNWTTVAIPNKYPAFLPFHKLEKQTEAGLYQRMNAVGFHEVVVTLDHKKSMAEFSLSQLKEVIDVYQARYLALMRENFVNYISIFHNHGAEAGASLGHPHSQIVTSPLIDIDLKSALFNSRNYFKRRKRCIYCQMNQWERRVKKRIVFENEGFIVLCPFASKAAFETIISPKSHLSHFEKTTEKEKRQLAGAFIAALSKLYKALNDPAYNFYLHTSPCDRKDYSFYHWHWTILPKTAVWAGFEIGTRMEISTIEPEKAAEYLRKQ